MKSNKTYWLCQLAGWGGMVAIDTINYVAFIVGKFSWDRFIIVSGLGLGGIVCTHIFRIILRKFFLFKAPNTKTWLVAIISTFILALSLSFLAIGITIVKSFFYTKKITMAYSIGYFVGAILNWIRYTGVWVIIYFMYKILQQNSAIQSEKLMLENLAKTTELELLKTQLNPHFLFNALNSIKALVIINPEQSRDAIVKLSELLRFTLQYGKERLIPIKDEMEEVKKYLELEQLRFGKRLTVAYDIDENTLSQTLPPAIVLTLAENAVKHGVARQMEDGFISVKTTIIENTFCIAVTNNGTYQPTASVGIGLKHITRRLEEVYNNKAEFSIHQVENNVVATIKTPVSWQ